MTRRPRIMGSPEERFWAYVDKSGGPDACWIWGGPRKRETGHGVFSIRDETRQSISAHRYALELALGRPIPPELFACHRCDNPPCVNPSHIFEGTPADNAWDMVDKGRTPTLTACRRGHPWTPESTLYKGTDRYCGICSNMRRRARYAKAKGGVVRRYTAR